VQQPEIGWPAGDESLQDVHGCNVVCLSLYWREAPAATPDGAATTARAALSGRAPANEGWGF
jgi:hypothetical protein